MTFRPASAGLEADQSNTIDFLRATFGTDNLHTTQAAHVLLAGDRAWKMKRAITLGFLDFSTADLRRRALEAELTLNRRTAPDLYLAIHSINRCEAGLQLDGSGEALDWVLEMKRFPDDALLEAVAVTGRLEIPVLVDLADTIVGMHAAAPPKAGWDSFDALAGVVEGNAARLSAVSELLPEAGWRGLIEKQRARLVLCRPLLARRALAGRVRRGHGDLHLQNIALIDGKAVPFDCLEFDETLATVDVLYDMAFLAMDLWRIGLRTHANILTNRYIDRSAADEDGMPLMPLFLSLRATVRAHVEATRAAGTSGASATAACELLRLAAMVLEPAEPRLVAIGGLSGTGKSTIARAIGAYFGAPPGARILRTDVLRKRAHGLAPEQELTPSAYTSMAARETYRALREEAARQVAAGVAVIADAAFLESAERTAMRDVAQRAKVRFVGLWLTVATAKRLARVGARTADASDADVQVAMAQIERAPDIAEDWAILEESDVLDRDTATALILVGKALGE